MTSSTATVTALSAVNAESTARVLLRDYTADVLRHAGFDDVQLCEPSDELAALQQPEDRSQLRLCHHRPVLFLKKERTNTAANDDNDAEESKSDGATNGVGMDTADDATPDGATNGVGMDTADDATADGATNGVGVDTADDATEAHENDDSTVNQQLDFRIDTAQDGTSLEALVTASECFLQVDSDPEVSLLLGVQR